MKKNAFFTVASKTLFKALVLNFICFIGGGMIVSVNSSNILRIVLQIAFFVAAILLFYEAHWNMGDSDSNFVKSGHKKAAPLKGLWSGLIGSCPFLLSGILLILEKCGVLKMQFLSYYRLINGLFYPLNYSLLPTDRSIIDMQWGEVLLSVSVLLIVPLICMFAYLIGTTGIRITEWIVYKKEKE